MYNQSRQLPNINCHLNWTQTFDSMKHTEHYATENGWIEGEKKSHFILYVFVILRLYTDIHGNISTTCVSNVSSGAECFQCVCSSSNENKEKRKKKKIPCACESVFKNSNYTI